jgi:hypothetical protein
VRYRVTTPLFLGILAMIVPATAIGLLWIVSSDKDYGFLLYAASVVLGVPPALVSSVLALRGIGPSKSRRQAWAGLILGLLAMCIYVIGGLGFFFLLRSILRHD